MDSKNIRNVGKVKNKFLNYTEWIARVILLIDAFFVVLMSFDSFLEESPLSRQIAGFFFRIIPALFSLLIFYISFRRVFLSGILALAVVIGMMSMIRFNSIEGALFLFGPMTLAGLILLICGWVKRKLNDRN